MITDEKSLSTLSNCRIKLINSKNTEEMFSCDQISQNIKRENYRFNIFGKRESNSSIKSRYFKFYNGYIDDIERIKNFRKCNEIQKGGHTLVVSKNKGDTAMVDLKSHLEKCLGEFADHIRISEKNQLPTPILSDNNMLIGDILNELANYENKSDVVNRFNLDKECINIVLKFASRVFNSINVAQENIFINNYYREEEIPIAYKILFFKQNYWSIDLIKQVYRFNPLEEKFINAYKKWYLIKYNERLNINSFNIWRLVEYQKWLKVIAIDKAAVYLGMTTDSLKMVIDKLMKILNLDKVYFSDELIYSDFIKELPKYLLMENNFKDHGQFCLKLHKRLKAMELEIEPVFCKTEKVLDANSKVLASMFDDLTGEPLNKKNAIMLDFNQPLFIEKYSCSVKTYSQFKSLLQPYLIGAEPFDLGER